MKRTTLGISAAILILAGTAFAAEDRGPAAAQPETRAEAQARAGALFDKLDLNHDGKLDQADRAVRINQEFDSIDTNHDGAISRDEFLAAHQHKWGGEHGGPGHPGGAGERGPGEHHGHWGYDQRELHGLVGLILHRADPGHTGTVTRDAFVRAALSLFDQADTNHDGVLTPEEHRAFAQALRQQEGAKWQQGGWHKPGGPDAMPPAPAPTN